MSCAHFFMFCFVFFQQKILFIYLYNDTRYLSHKVWLKCVLDKSKAFPGKLTSTVTRHSYDKKLAFHQDALLHFKYTARAGKFGKDWSGRKDANRRRKSDGCFDLQRLSLDEKTESFSRTGATQKAKNNLIKLTNTTDI